MNLKLKKNNVTQSDIFYLLVIITPLVDTINGAYVLKNGGTGVSIGTFYRLFLILFSALVLVTHRVKKQHLLWLLLSLYFPINCVIRYGAFNISFMSALSYGIKWVFPIFLMTCFTILQRSTVDRTCIKVMDCWRYLIPGLLVIEYLLGIGEKTYWDAGFRGLYFSINDVSFSLTMMISYSLYKLIMIEVSKKNIIAVFLNFIAIVILATKSCVIFAVLGGAYFFVVKYKKSMKKAIIYTFVIAILMVFGFFVMQEKIIEMLNRYIRFYDQMSTDGGEFAQIMFFLTSARTARIGVSLEGLYSQFSVVKLLFGWKAPYNEGAIEMDWYDSFFQHGIMGFVILLGYCYTFLFKKRDYKTPWLFMLIVAMICSFFSGHVLNGALSSTVLAVVAQCAFSSKCAYDVKNLDQCKLKLENIVLK